MPRFKIEIFKRTPGSDDWGNAYHAVSDDLADATSLANLVAQAEQIIHQDYVNIERARISRVFPDTDEFNTLVLNYPGLRSAVSVSLPLWNTFRIDFSVLGSRPSRKYMRGPVLQVDQNGTQIQASGFSIMNAYITAIEAQFSADGIAPGLVDESGNPFASAAAFGQVVMLPLHKRRKARSVVPPTP